MGENNNMGNEVQRRRAEIEELSFNIAQLDQRLKLDVQRQKSKHLKEEKNDALMKNEELRMQVGELNLPLDELKEKFVTKIKTDSDQIKALEDRAKDLKRMIDTYSRTLLDYESQAKNKDRQSETEKYELLMNKDKEIDEFFARFDGDKAREEQGIQTLQGRVEQTLEELAEVAHMIENIPDEKKAKELIGEHEFKSGMVHEAKFTLEKLKLEREKLNKEMVKYSHIDKRLGTEVELAQQRLAGMNADIGGKFASVDQVKADLEGQIEQERRKKEFLFKKRD